MQVDVLIVGGGPAGLSAALVLGRASKRVLLCDAGPPRNAAAHEMHSFVTRDGTPPKEFRRVAHEQLGPYETVEVREARVLGLERSGALFRAQLSGGEVVEARRVLLAVGMVDLHPELPGYRELWGESIFHCPYCHGWEVRGRAFGMLATTLEGAEFALFLTGWSRDLVLFTNGMLTLPEELRARLARARVRVEERPVKRLVGEKGALQAVELADGTQVAREVLFLRPEQRQTELVQKLGLALDEKGYVRVNEQKESSLPGLHVAGDATMFMQQALFSAAEGAAAAFAINHALTLEDAVRAN